MVQNVGSPIQAPSTNKYGTVKKIGTTENGRIVYQIIDPAGKLSGNLSVASNHADVFEKSYNQLLENAPKIEKYTASMDPVKMEKIKNRGKWIRAIFTCVGGGIPMIKVKGGTWKQIGLTALGTIAGFITGSLVAGKVTTPPGAKEFAQATQTISKLDIKPI